MAAIFITVMLTFVERGGSLIYTTQPLYGGSQHLIHSVIEPLVSTRAVCPREYEGADRCD